jgi:hypothetical protein
MHEILLVIVTIPVVQPAPLQPLNVDPSVGVAFKVTVVPLVYDAEQVPLQMLIPAGVDVTVPLPVPYEVTVFTTVTANVYCCGLVLGLVLNVAVQFVLAVITIVPELQPVPLQPANTDPAAAIAVSVTAVPLLYVAEHVAPQLIAVGELETVPLPVPAFVTVRENV